jgi:hypothetical protein
MKTNVIVRYVSGREEKFEMELFGGTSAEARLKEFVKNPAIVLQTEEEVIIIPATAIESITLPIPASAGKKIVLPDVRRARRLK